MDRTDILVGVNLEIAVPDLDTPDRGLLTCAVECATSASAGFEGRTWCNVRGILQECVQLLANGFACCVLLGVVLFTLERQPLPTVFYV